MKSFLYHLQINVSSSRALNFYKELLLFLEYEIITEFGEGFGAHANGADIWVMLTEEKYLKNSYNRKNIGMNHLAFGVTSRQNVGKFVKEFLNKKAIEPLYSSPKEYPEYDKDYYAVYFEDPDRIKLEVVYKQGFEKII